MPKTTIFRAEALGRHARREVVQPLLVVPGRFRLSALWLASGFLVATGYTVLQLRIPVSRTIQVVSCEGSQTAHCSGGFVVLPVRDRFLLAKERKNRLGLTDATQTNQNIFAEPVGGTEVRDLAEIRHLFPGLVVPENVEFPVLVARVKSGGVQAGSTIILSSGRMRAITLLYPSSIGSLLEHQTRAFKE